MNIQTAIQNLHDTTMAFYGDCLRKYPELLAHPILNGIEADMKRPVPPDMKAEENPVYRMLVFLSEYEDCIELPSYDAVYNAFETLTALVLA